MCVRARLGSNPGPLGSKASALTNCASCQLVQSQHLLPFAQEFLRSSKGLQVCVAVRMEADTGPAFALALMQKTLRLMCMRCVWVCLQIYWTQLWCDASVSSAGWSCRWFSSLATHMAGQYSLQRSVHSNIEWLFSSLLHIPGWNAHHDCGGHWI